MLRRDFDTLGIRTGFYTSHDLRYGFVPIHEDIAWYWTSTERVDDTCSPHRRPNLYCFRTNSQMLTHNRQLMSLEIMQQVLRSGRFSEAWLQLGSPSQEDTEIPDRPGIPGDQGVIATGIERNDVARPDSSLEGIGKGQSASAGLEGNEDRYHPIHIVTPRIEAGVDNPARRRRWHASVANDSMPPPHIRSQAPGRSCRSPWQGDVDSDLFDMDAID